MLDRLHSGLYRTAHMRCGHRWQSIGFTWLRMGTSGGLSCTQQWYSGLRTRQGIPYYATISFARSVPLSGSGTKRQYLGHPRKFLNFQYKAGHYCLCTKWGNLKRCNAPGPLTLQGATILPNVRNHTHTRHRVISYKTSVLQRIRLQSW
jgi:hypothetical protein